MPNYVKKHLKGCLESGATERGFGEHICCHYCSHPLGLSDGDGHCLHIPGGPVECWPQQIKRLRETLHSHSLERLAEWLNQRGNGEHHADVLTEDLMREAGFIDATLRATAPPEETLLYGKVESLRALATTDKQRQLLDAIIPVAWNEFEVLVYLAESRKYQEIDWSEYGAGVLGNFEEYINPAHYEDGEYIMMMSGETRRIVI